MGETSMRFRKLRLVAAVAASGFAVPTLAQEPPSLVTGSRHHHLTAEQCLSAAAAAARARGWIAEAPSGQTLELRQGAYRAAVVCAIRDIGFVTVTGPAAGRSRAMTLRDQLIQSLVANFASSSGGAAPAAQGSAPQQRPMPPMPGSVQEALAISRPINAQHLVGRWTDSGNCANNITFSADGQFRNSVDGSSGRWSLNGEELSFIGQSTVGVRVRGVGQNRMIVIHKDQSMGQSIRC